MKNSTFRKISSLVLAVCLIAFVLYQVIRSNKSGVRTETAMYGTAWDSVNVDAAVIRSEKYITVENGAVYNFTVENGEHVARNSVLATIYNNEADATAALEIGKLQDQIAQLKKLDTMASDQFLSPDAYDRLLGNQLVDLRSAIERKKLSSVNDYAQLLLYSINQKQIVSGKANGYKNKIAELQNEYDSKSTSYGGVVGWITAPMAGYFIENADGYENLYSYAEAKNLTVEDLRMPRTQQAVPDGVIGKICDEHIWYIAFEVDKTTAVEFKNLMESGSKVYLSMPFASVSKIPAEIAAVNQSDFESEGAVILECHYMDEKVSSLRFEEIQIELYSHSGIMVSQSNVHFADVEETIYDDDGNASTVIHKNVQGVYVVNGLKMEFVQIFPIATVNGYVICKTQPGDDDQLVTYDTIRLYDSVITEGKDLYDGKYIE